MGQDRQSQTDQSDVVEGLHVPPSRTAAAPVLTGHGAMRSRHWRFWLGLFELGAGVLTGLVTVANAGQIQDVGTSGAQPPAGIIAVILVFGAVAIAGIVIGIWNLATLRSAARSPLIAAIVVSAASIVLTMVFIGGPLFDPVKIVWAALHAVVSVWTVGILRLKKFPAP